MQLKFLVVDDEKLSRSYVTSLLRELAPRSVIVEAASGKAALPHLEELKPDVLFLDIQMPEMDGFEFLSNARQRDFELVFVTAYSQYAINAIKEGAIDYVLKPIKKSEFKETLARVIAKVEEKRVTTTTEDWAVDPYLRNKLKLSHHQGIKFAMLQNIIYFRADNSYTTLYMSNGEKITTTKPIHQFERALDPKWFFRIHKSYLINFYHFKEYISRQGSTVLMSNGDKLMLSRYRLKDFLSVIRNSAE